MKGPGRPRKGNPHVERREHVQRAMTAFVKAAGALTTWPMERDALALALLEGAMGLHLLAKADHDLEALGKVERVLEIAKESKR